MKCVKQQLSIYLCYGKKKQFKVTVSTTSFHVFCGHLAYNLENFFLTAVLKLIHFVEKASS